MHVQSAVTHYDAGVLDEPGSHDPSLPILRPAILLSVLGNHLKSILGAVHCCLGFSFHKVQVI